MKKRRITITADNISWGITALLVICGSMTFYLVLTKMPSLKEHLGTIAGILMPFIMGIVFAYLLLPVFNFVYRNLKRPLLKKFSEYHSDGIARGSAAAVSVILLVTLLTGLLVLAVPQIIQSIISIAYTIPPNLEKLSDQITQLLKDNPRLMRTAEEVFLSFETNLNTIIRESVIPYFTNALGGITKGIINVTGFIFDFIIGIIVCLYILFSKDKFSAQGKKLVYSVLNTESANRLLSDTRKIHQIFGGFISGSIIDSTIIGLLTFIVLPVMNMPYVTMISVIIGVTNIIPFFGPFIGAVPSILIVLMVNPVKSIYLTIFIIVLQQLDGNVIKPKTLGTSTGLPSFWVLFAILVGGGFFGFPGLLLGVPVFATIYMIVTRRINRGLEKRGLPKDTDIYRRLYYVDPANCRPVEQEEVEKTGYPFGEADDQFKTGLRLFHRKQKKAETAEAQSDGSDGPAAFRAEQTRDPAENMKEDIK